MIAFVCKHYPAYKIDDVLNEYISRIIVLVRYATHHHAQERLESIETISVPYLKQHEQQAIKRKYQKLLNPLNNDKIDIQKDRENLKNLLGGTSV